MRAHLVGEGGQAGCVSGPDGLRKEKNQYRILFMSWWALLKSYKQGRSLFMIINGEVIEVLSIRESRSELARGAVELVSSRKYLSTGIDKIPHRALSCPSVGKTSLIKINYESRKRL